jgi:hypothetical protein
VDNQTDRSAVIATLRGRGVPESIATIFADQLLTYREANENVQRNGSIVAHPRTGEPMENPYLKLRDAAAAKMLKYRNVDATGLW